MKPAWTSLAAMGLLLWQLCTVAGAQDQNREQEPGAVQEASQTSQTGAGLRSVETTAAKTGEAGGVENSGLGGQRRPPYRLTRSDVVAVSFTLSPEFDQTLTVQPDGVVLLKDAGPVLAEGLTLAQFRLAVRTAYAGYLHDPQVAVALKEFEHPYFVAGGEVRHPGKYELRAETSVIEAVQIAGGFTRDAKHSQVILFRDVDGDLVEARLLDLKKMLKEKSLGEDPHLRPGDFIFVPQNALSKIAQYLSKPSMSMYVSSAQF
jgi:polysaccharide export outer membrane protein